MVAMFVNGSELNQHLYKGPSKDASYQVSVHLAKRFQRPYLLTDRDKMSKLQRGPSIDASYMYHVSVHLAKRLQRRFFRNQPIRNKNCLWRPCLIMDWDEMSNLYRGPAIDASYKQMTVLLNSVIIYCTKPEF